MLVTITMGAEKLSLFSVKFIDYNSFSNVDAGEAVHSWRGCEDLRFSYVAVKKWACSGRIYGARSHKKHMIVAAVEDAIRDC